MESGILALFLHQHILTSLLIQSQIYGSVATRSEFLLEKILVFDVSCTRLDEPGAVEAHHVRLCALCCVYTTA